MNFTRGLRVCLAAQPADLRRSFEGHMDIHVKRLAHRAAAALI